MHQGILSLEAGIPLLTGSNIQEAFKDNLKKRNQATEWRIMNRITLNQDHVKNLPMMDQTGFKDQNRYDEVLPFKHSQVVIG